jgi:methionyl-tRNA formyltransferase
MASASSVRAPAPRHRVVLLGGKALAVQCLDSMLRMSDVDVVGVVPCADDNAAAQRWYPSLAGYAQERGLAIHQPRSINDRDFFPVLERLRPDVLLSVFYDKILRPRLLELPGVAAVNLHFGLLPYNRGSLPIPWAIIDGNDPGVTMHYMDAGVDTGDVIGQLAVPAGDHETAFDVYERCTKAGVFLFERYFPLLLRGRAPRRAQDAVGTYYRPGYPFDRWIGWWQTSEQVSCFVRALTFPPFPSARTAFRGTELEVCHPVWAAEDDRCRPAGTVLEIAAPYVTVATGNGSCTMSRARVEGVELPAAEAFQRAGVAAGDLPEERSWQERSAA